MLGLVLLVLFVHFGGSNVPKVLKDNKQMVYGVTIGLVLCSFFGVNVEGVIVPPAFSSTEELKQCWLDNCNSHSSSPLYCECSPHIDNYMTETRIETGDIIYDEKCNSSTYKESIWPATQECIKQFENY